MKYFNSNNCYPHGIMFHHFHDNKKHLPGQGSIGGDDLYKIIKFVGKSNILNADDFYKKLIKNNLKNSDVCLTFDDGIKSQIDVALPILEHFKIKAFFFVYGSLFTGKPDLLEVYRYFRNNYYGHINEFYSSFYKYLKKDYIKFLKSKKKQILLRKKLQPFYSIMDLEFRFIRNDFITKNEYKKIMLKLFLDKGFMPKKTFKNLFFSNKDINNLNSLGHEIGLHSFSHPTNFRKLNFINQHKEYKKNLSMILRTIKRNKSKIISMSHPCGSYNKSTFKVLSNLNIEIGFKNIMGTKSYLNKKLNTKFEIPRENHTNIINRINKRVY